MRSVVDQIHEATIGLMPDVTLVMDIDPEMAARRRGGRADGMDRIEAKGLEFQARLQKVFREIVAADPVRCTAINASASLENIHEWISAVVHFRLVRASVSHLVTDQELLDPII